MPLSGPAKAAHAIFTSQNAVRAVLKSGIAIQNAYCVGSLTAQRLQSEGIPVRALENSSEALANTIVRDFSELSFYFFSGNIRVEALPATLSKKGVAYSEIKVYETQASPVRLQNSFDGLLFFSPSGVESFTQANPPMGIAFCLGPTTAAAAQRYFTDVKTASNPSVDDVLTLAISTLN